MSSKSQPFHFHRIFNSLEALQEGAKGWDLDFAQMDCGPFQADLTQVISDGLMLNRFQCTRQLRQRGSTPEGTRTFAISIDPNTRFVWFGREIKGNQIALFPRNRDLDAFSYSGFDVYPISVSEARLERLREQLGFSSASLTQLPKEDSVFNCDPQAMAVLRSTLFRVFRESIKGSATPAKRLTCSILSEGIPQQLLYALVLADPERSKVKGWIRDWALDRAISYMEAYAQQAPLIAEIARKVGASPRTLEMAFRERFGVSPNKYLKGLRLNRVRQFLANPKSEETTVSAVARSWGFTHGSHFAGDYEKLFGELPSETLHGHVSAQPQINQAEKLR